MIRRPTLAFPRGLSRCSMWTLLAVAAIIGGGCCRHHGRHSLVHSSATMDQQAPRPLTSNLIKDPSPGKPNPSLATTTRCQSAKVSTRRRIFSVFSVQRQPASITPAARRNETPLAPSNDEGITAHVTQPVAEPNVDAQSIYQPLDSQQLLEPLVRPSAPLTSASPAIAQTPSHTLGELLATRQVNRNENAALPYRHQPIVQPALEPPLDTSTVTHRPKGIESTAENADQIILRAVAVTPYLDIHMGPQRPTDIPPARLAGKMLGPGEMARDLTVVRPHGSNGQTQQPASAPSSRIVTQPFPSDPRQVTLQGVATTGAGKGEGRPLQIAELPSPAGNPETHHSPPGDASILVSPLPRPMPDRDSATSDPRR